MKVTGNQVRSIIVGITIILLGCSKDEELVETRLHSYAPAMYNNRTNELFGCIQLDNRNIEIEIWDSSTPDGDKIALIINGKEISGSELMKSYPNREKISYTLDYNGYNYIIVPTIDVGGLRHCEIIMSINGQRKTLLSTLNSNAYLNLVVGNDAICSTKSESESNIMFWASEDPGCGYINVTLEEIGSLSLSKYYTGVVPDCKADGCITFENLAAGTYHYVIECGVEGDIVVDGSNTCYKIELNG